MGFLSRQRRFRSGAALLGAILADGGEMASHVNELPATERALVAGTLDAALQLDAGSRRDLFRSTVADYFRSDEGSLDQLRYSVLGHALRDILLLCDNCRFSFVEGLESAGRYEAFPHERPEPSEAAGRRQQPVDLAAGEIVRASDGDNHRCKFSFSSRGILALPPSIRMDYSELEAVWVEMFSELAPWYAGLDGRALHGSWMDDQGERWTFSMGGSHLWEVLKLLENQGVNLTPS